MALVIFRMELTDFILALTTFKAAKFRVDPKELHRPGKVLPNATLVPSISGIDKVDLDFFKAGVLTFLSALLCHIPFLVADPMHGNKKMKRAHDSVGADVVIKGNCDRREYRILNLSNGIEVILVKMPEGQSSKAAVSIAVGAGSMHEQDDLGGLAHFVEHCVFLGNKKYPTRNSLDKLLAKHNGYSNAHTELEYTAYYLEVNQEGLSKAVDIFSAAFTSPSFDQEMCVAELEAVDSEFHEILNNDDCRIEQMICALSQPDHKFRKFTWGNRASLLKQGPEILVKSAEQFFNSHYSPERMKISLVSSLSFEKMEKLVRAFESIPTRDVSQIPLCPLQGMTFPIPSAQLPLTLFMEPVAELHQLIFLFQLPSILGVYSSKPTDYISHLIGHEASGSLIANLRDSLLASDLTAGVGSEGYSSNSGMSMFEIKITLTSLGRSQWQRVAQDFVFPYIELVKQRGVDESVYSELREVGRIEFNHSTEDSTKEPIDTAEELAIQLLDHLAIDRQHLLIHDYLYRDTLAEDQIKEYLSYISKERAIVILVSPENEGGEKEPVFGISYSKKKSLISDISDINIGCFVVPPVANPFVPKRLEIDPITAEQIEAPSTNPSEIIEDQGLRIFCFNKIRSQPCHKVDIRLRLNIQPQQDMSIVDSFVSTHLRAAYLTDLLESKLYTAKLVGFGISISAVPPGKGNACTALELCANGFQEHIVRVMELMLETATQPPQEIERFERIFEQIKRGYINEEIHPATNQGSNIRKSVLAPKSFFRAGDKLISIEKFKRLDEEVKCAFVDGVIVGSYTESIRDAIVELVKVRVGNISSEHRHDPVDVVKIVSEETFVVEPTINPKEPTSCLLIYYQLSPEFNPKISAVADVLSDLMSEPFFDCLRTEEQLGYSVQCGARYTNGSVGIEFSIQSSSETPANMVAKVEHFIRAFYYSEIEPMEAEEFDDQIYALTDSLVEPPTSLAKETRDIWSEVTENRLMWNVLEQTKAEIENMFIGKKEMVKEMIEKYLVKDRRIVVQVNGSGK